MTPRETDRGERAAPVAASAGNFHVVIHGTGTVELAAFGIADAEATVEKEVRALLPGATVRIGQVRRAGPNGRIVETFEVTYSVAAGMEIAGVPDEESARRGAYRAGRTALERSRYGLTAWSRAEVTRVRSAAP